MPAALPATSPASWPEPADARLSAAEGPVRTLQVAGSPIGRLLARLDALARRSVVWLAAPAGAGKTTLVAEWLGTQERPALWLAAAADDRDRATLLRHLVDALPPSSDAASRPWLTAEQSAEPARIARAVVLAICEELQRRHGTAPVIVVDNAEILAGSGAMQALSAGAAALPAGCTLVMLSHELPDEAFARLEAQGAVGLLGWQELALLQPEGLVVARAAGIDDLDRAREVVALADGWASGIVLLADRLRALGADALEPAGAGMADVFDRLAGPAFDARDEATRAFLMRTALLDPVQPDAACALTGRDDARAFLDALVTRGLFTRRLPGTEPAYRYHALFRAFLMRRARETIAPQAYATVSLEAGRRMEQAGRLEEAVARYADAGAHENLRTLVLREADRMVEEGRGAVLEAWIARLPSANAGADPTLEVWRALARLSVDPRTATEKLRAVAQASAADGDTELAALACAGVLQSYLMTFGKPGAVDPWIDLLAALVDASPGGWSRGTERRVHAAAVLMMLRKPGHPTAARLSQRALAQIGATAEEEHRLQLACAGIVWTYWHAGPVQGRELVRLVDGCVDLDRVSPVSALQWLYGACAMLQVDGRIDETLHLAHRGFALAERHALPVHGAFLRFYAALACVRQGDVAHAETMLDRLTREAGGALARLEHQVHFVRGAIALARGDVQAATGWSRRAATDDRGMTHPMFVAAFRIGALQCRLEAGDAVGVGADAAQALAFAKSIGSPILAWGAGLVLAEARHATGDLDADAHLRDALEVASIHGFAEPFPLWRPHAMAELLSRRLRARPDDETATSIVRRLRLAAPAPDTDPWPWPVRVHAFGPLRIEIAGEPLRFDGKVQHRPLELMAALVAFGGQDVAEHHLADALWPQADGDRARKSLEMAIHRLRRLLGDERSLVVRGGRVSLNRSVVWVDVSAFERRADKLEARRGFLGPPPEDPLGAILLHGGALLSDVEASWVVQPREALRERVARHLSRSLAAVAGRQPAPGAEAAPAVEALLDAVDRAARQDPASAPLQRLLAQTGALRTDTGG